MIPGASTLAAPLQFRRSQDFYISSNIEFDCNISQSIITQWTINTCNSTCLSPFSFNQSVLAMTFSELYVPPKTLPYGTYQLTLQVTMNIFTNLTASASAYIQINPSDIIVNFFQLGPSMVTTGHQQDLKLNPGMFSIDPDADVFNGNVSIDRQETRFNSRLYF